MFHFLSPVCSPVEEQSSLFIRIQVRINQLLIFIEKLSPLMAIEPRTSQVPSRCAAN